MDSRSPADGFELRASTLPAPDAFEALYESVRPSLWRYVHRLLGDPDLADDIVQEAFVRLLDRFESRGEGARLWLFTVATNLVRDRGRMTARRRRLLATHPIIVPPPLGADDRLVRQERIAAVREALQQLPERDRQLLLLREEGFSYREIAQSVGVAPTSVGTLIARAVRRFMQHYTPVEE